MGSSLLALAKSIYYDSETVAVIFSLLAIWERKYIIIGDHFQEQIKRSEQPSHTRPIYVPNGRRGSHINLVSSQM